MVLLAALSCPQECGPGSLPLPSWRTRAPCEFNAFQRLLLGKWSLGPVSSFPHRALSSGTTMGMTVCQGGGLLWRDEWVGTGGRGVGKRNRV